MAHPTSSDFGAAPAFWHGQFLRQAEWTRDLRYHLYRTLEIARCNRILDLGCGTGVIAAELAERAAAEVHAADHDRSLIAFARREHRDLPIRWHVAEAMALPFANGAFDLVVTHYFWLWAAPALAIANECRRVLASGGKLAALCEPDYGGRRDEPAELAGLGEMFRNDLAAKGADPCVGPKLPGLFASAGFKVETGSVENAWDNERHRGQFDQEWRAIATAMPLTDALRRLRERERGAIGQGRRRSLMPVHWCVGRR